MLPSSAVPHLIKPSNGKRSSIVPTCLCILMSPCPALCTSCQITWTTSLLSDLWVLDLRSSPAVGLLIGRRRSGVSSRLKFYVTNLTSALAGLVPRLYASRLWTDILCACGGVSSNHLHSKKLSSVERTFKPFNTFRTFSSPFHTDMMPQSGSTPPQGMSSSSSQEDMDSERGR